MNVSETNKEKATNELLRQIRGDLYERGADIDHKKKHEGCPLLWSIYKGQDEDCVDFLHQHGVDINGKNECANIALLYSAYKGQLVCLKYLLRQGTDIAAKDSCGHTVLLYSAMFGHLNCVKYVIENVTKSPDFIGSSHNSLDDALHLSALKGYLTCIKYLVQAGADINKKGKYGFTALQWAEAKGHQNIVAYLKEQKTSFCVIL